MIYLTKIKDEKLFNEVMKDIKEIRRADKIIELVQNLETSNDNTKKILSATSEAKVSHADVKDRTREGSADEIKCYRCQQTGHTKGNYSVPQTKNPLCEVWIEGS